MNAIRRAPKGGFVFAGSVMATAKGQETALRYMAELQGGPGQPSPEKTDETPMESAESIPGAMVEDVDPSRVATLPTDSYTDADKIPSVEQAMGAQSENAIGASTDEKREANSSPVEAAAPLVGEIELVISGPFEPIKFLNLIQWLKDAGNAVIEEVMTSGQEQTVVRVTIRKSMPLLRMLAGIPDVAEVIEEPYTGSPDVFAESVQALGGKAKLGAGQTSLIRFRLKFRPST